MNEKDAKKNITMSEIAKLAGVTRATVSYVLNNRADLKISDETRNKILAISKQYDYKPPVKVKKEKPVKPPRPAPIKRITMADIAKEAEVSTATVSYVLNNRTDVSISDEVRKKVLQICNLRQYQPSRIAQSLATASVFYYVGIAFNYYTDGISYNTHIFDLLRHLQHFLLQAGFIPVLLPPIGANTKKQGNLDGIICIDLSEEQFYSLKESYYVPIIPIDMVIEDTLFYKTYDDYFAIAEYAKKHFGTPSLTFITTELQNRPYYQKIQSAFKDGAVYVVTNRERLIEFVRTNRSGNFLFCDELLASLCLQFISPANTAVMCSEKNFSLIPEDFCKIYLPAEQKAKHCVEMLQNAIQRREAEPHTFRLTPQL